MHDVTLVTTAAELAALAAQLLRHDAVAVDTEFFWERTFYPILGLVQLATRDNRCWLVDAVQISDLAALGPVLACDTVTKVLHDAPQDLAILARATGAKPCRIFDTRLAAGFAGFDPACSLQSLVQDTLNVALCKDETRSDWLRRPLRASQLHYAAEDVRYLLALRDDLQVRCASDDVRAWLQEELRRLDDVPSCLERDPYCQYLRVKGLARLSGRQLAILREVAAWREREARQRDWPRGHVLPDELLLTLAILAPAEPAVLARVPDFPRTMPAQVVDDLLRAVARGVAVPDAACPAPTREDRSGRQGAKAKADALLAHIRSGCAVHRVHPALVASRGEAESFLQLAEAEAREHLLAQGWRKQFVAGRTQ